MLIAVASPRVRAQIAVLSLGDVREGLSSGRELAPERLWLSRDIYNRAVEIAPNDASLLITRALISRRLAAISGRAAGPAGEGGQSCDADCLRAEAYEYLRRTVAAAPSNGFAWALYADAGLELGKPASEVLPALRLSRLTTPNRASALLVQFRIAMLHWEAMPQEFRAYGVRHVSEFWQQRELRRHLVDVYLRAGLPARAAFRAQLGQEPALLEQFDHLMLSGEELPRRRRR
ncbi:MAG: hypothetical protein KF895_00955 [Parvibaculum sp.]|nr:hypothetical protein [Parvibaculum sp.]